MSYFQFSFPARFVAWVLALGAATASGLVTLKGAEEASFGYAVVGLMNQASRLAQAGDFKAVAELAKSNSGFATEILATGLENAGSNRAQLIAAALAVNAGQKAALAAAVAMTTTQAQFQAEFPSLLSGLTPSEMVNVAKRALPKNPSVAAELAGELGVQSGIPRPKLAGLLASSAPAAAAAITSGLMASVRGPLSTEQWALACGSIAAAAATAVPAQAAAIASCPFVAQMQFSSLMSADASAVVFMGTVAAAVAKVVPAQAVAITTAVLQASASNYARYWPANYGNDSLAMVNAIAQSVPANQRLAIAAAAESVAKQSPNPVRLEVSYASAAQAQPYSTVPSLADQSIAAAKVASASPMPSAVPAPPANSGTTPQVPIDPSLIVSPSR